MLTRADKWLIAFLMALSTAGIGLGSVLFPTPSSQEAEIWQDGRLVRTIPLRQGYREEFRLGGAEHYNVIEMNNGRIRVLNADCPDRICVRTGWVSAAPNQIVCLPWKVVIKVVSATPPDIDGISR